MEKTKIGLSVPVAGALGFLLFALCGSTVGFLYLGFVLLVEADAGLKRTALSAAIIYVGFALLVEVLSVIPDGFNLLENIVYTFDGSLNVAIVDKIWNLLSSIISYARGIVFLVLAFNAYKGKAVELAFVKKLIG